MVPVCCCMGPCAQTAVAKEAMAITVVSDFIFMFAKFFMGPSSSYCITGGWMAGDGVMSRLPRFVTLITTGRFVGAQFFFVTAGIHSLVKAWTFSTRIFMKFLS